MNKKLDVNCLHAELKLSEPTLKRVLLIIPNLDFGGAQISFAKLSSLLSEEFVVQMVVFNTHDMAKFDLKGKLESLEIGGSSNFVGKIIAFMRRIKKLRSIKIAFKPDISISFLEGADYVNYLSKAGDKIWFYVHGSKTHDRNIKGWLGIIRRKLLLPFFFSRADKILVVTNHIKFELSSEYSVKNVPIVEMRNFFDLDDLKAKSLISMPDNVRNLLETQQTICICGRIASEKGVDRFVSVFAELLMIKNDVKLLVIGDGPDMDSVRNEISKYDLQSVWLDNPSASLDTSNQVYFLGYQENPFPYIKLSTVLALPSLNEGMPNVLVEGLALGIPIVAADCPYGPFELLTNGSPEERWPNVGAYGIVLPVLDGEAGVKRQWVDALNKLIDSPTLRSALADNGKLRARNFSLEVIRNKWFSELNEEGSRILSI